MHTVDVKSVTVYDMTGTTSLLGSYINIIGCEFYDNSALFANGGALYIDYNTPSNSLTTLNLQGNSFINNTANEGVVLYYSRRRLNLIMTDNVFDSDVTVIDQGSVLAFVNVTFDGIQASQNQFRYSTSANSIYFFKFLSPQATNNSISLYFTALNFFFQSDFDGEIINIQNGQSNLNFVFDNMVVEDTLSVSDGLSHLFSVLEIDSTSVTIQNSNFSNLVSN